MSKNSPLPSSSDNSPSYSNIHSTRPPSDNFSTIRKNKFNSENFDDLGFFPPPGGSDDYSASYRALFSRLQNWLSSPKLFSEWQIINSALILNMALGFYLLNIQTSKADIAVCFLLLFLSSLGLWRAYCWWKSHDELSLKQLIAVDGYDAAPYAYLIFNSQGNLIFLNKVSELLFADNRLKNFEDLLGLFADHPNKVKAMNKLYDSVKGGKSQHVDLAITSEGYASPSWWRISASPLNKLPNYTLWCFADITPTRQNLIDLSHDPSFLLEVVNNLPAAFFTLSAEGKLLFANRTLAEWLMMKLSALIGQPIDSITTDHLTTLANLSYKSTSTISLKNVKGEEKDFKIQPFRLNSGTSLGYFLWPTPYSDNYSDSGIASGPAPYSEADAHRLKFEAIFNDAPMGIVVLNPANQVTTFNQTFKSMLYNYENLSNHPKFIDLVDQEQKEKFLQKLANLTQNKVSDFAPLEIRLIGQKNMALSMYVHKLVRHYPEHPGSPSHEGWILYFIDNTEQKRLEMQFVQSQKMQAIGQLAGGIAHDFNNLLTAMIGFCDLLLLRLSPTESSFSDVMQIKQNANRAANLVRQLLAFSRQQKLQTKVLQITDILVELSALLRRLLGPSIELQVINDRSVSTIKVDQGQIEQVIINLAVNARDAMPGGGKLLIKVNNFVCDHAITYGEEIMQPGKYVEIAVQDNGTGIKPEHLNRIFEPFFSTKEVGSGTGLGLSTVYGIVRQTGGFIAVDSKTQQGTTFKIFFPAYVQEEPLNHLNNPLENTPDSTSPLSPKNSPITDLTGYGSILLVEDEDAVRMFSARALRDKGYRVIEVASAESALEYINQSFDEIDLMITDIVMPQMDGVELIKRVRGLREKLLVIAISGYTEETFHDILDREKNVFFLAKPFTLNDLALKVKEILSIAKVG